MLGRISGCDLSFWMRLGFSSGDAGCVIKFARVGRFLRLIGGLVWPGCLDLRCSE